MGGRLRGAIVLAHVKQYKRGGKIGGRNCEGIQDYGRGGRARPHGEEVGGQRLKNRR